MGLPAASFSIIIKSPGGHLGIHEYTVYVMFGVLGGWFRGWFRLVPVGSASFLIYTLESYFALVILVRGTHLGAQDGVGSGVGSAWFRLGFLWVFEENLF